MQPWLGERGDRGRRRGDRAPAGWRRAPAWPRSRPPSPTPSRPTHAVAVSNCTTALHLALIVAGVGPGDDVVVPSFSFIATANAADLRRRPAGLRRRRADTGNLTAETVEAALTPAHPRGDRRRPGRRAGRPRLDPRRSATRAGITVIEDAACGAGSTYRAGRSGPAPRSPPGHSTRARSSPPARAG